MSAQHDAVEDKVAELVADGALTIAEASKFCGLTRTELYRRMGNGELPYVKLGKRRLIGRNALRSLLATGTVLNRG
ncbi:excisionase family dna binding domain-containing protein : : HTH_17 [Gemmata massiliana]|uniref:Excisionase family dna binding domain-containing protein:: HTH_17 n=1 Tax=Gemmata massiliana TaxID=1210884 RepID=A0A6P2CYJ1_9BACT|nr:helix-turn-helix domain-containing protein [Gemmata massiliana]VTR94061.1 excisionase family dna binding domain-containing protein : : HTH_17 [Gemmata massiliana]